MDHADSPSHQALELSIRDLLERWPAATQLLIAYRMACVGCLFSHFHSARQVLEIYELDPNEFLDELRSIINPELPSDLDGLPNNPGKGVLP